MDFEAEGLNPRSWSDFIMVLEGKLLVIEAECLLKEASN